MSVSELKSVGEKHNEYVNGMFVNLVEKGEAFSSQNIEKEFKEMDVDLSGTELTLDEIVDKAVDYSNQCNAKNKTMIANSEMSEELSYYLNEVNSAIVDDYENTIDNLNKLEDIVVSDQGIANEDYNVVIGTIGVAKHSAKLWMDGDLDVSVANKYVPQATPKSTVTADASASSAYFLGIGASAMVGLATPVTAVGVLGGWAISAAIGSAMHYAGA